jgi:hypothetical protein
MMVAKRIQQSDNRLAVKLKGHGMLCPTLA